MMQKTTDTQAVNRQLGARLRQARRMRKLSQKQLGATLSPPISFQQVQKYENGTNRISVPTLQQLSKILQLPISFFMADAAVPPAPILTPNEVDLLHNFRATSPTIQAALLVVLQHVERG